MPPRPATRDQRPPSRAHAKLALMRGRVIAGLLSTFLFAASALPQCDYRVQFSGEYRASIFDIAIDGNDLWTASGYGVQLYDRSVDPPRLIATAGVPGVTRIVRVSNDVAYAAGTNGISVIGRTGSSLQLVRTIPIGAVNDLLLIPGALALFAATPTGIIEFSLLDPQNPKQTPATFATSNPAVTSLAVIGSTLYAADGDSSIEVFSIVVPSSPQKNGTLTSLGRATRIEAAGTRLYVSEGITTEVFASAGPVLTSLGTFPYPTTSIADAGANVIFAAGDDRQWRAFDLMVPQNYVELFDDEIAPTAGTVNRVTALQIANGRLYVGGGDSGISTYDISRFAAPFPLRAYGIGATTSVVILPTAIYSGRSGTGIQEMTRSTSGALVLARQWSPDNETVQDGGNGFLLSSTGATLKFWTVNSEPPMLITTSTFRAAIRTAFLSASTAIALLADGTLWTTDLSQLNPVPIRVATGAGPLVQLAHSNQATAATEISAGGTTTLHEWSGDLNAAPADTTIPGASTALAVNDSSAAVFTFRGITIVNANGSLSVLPGSNGVVVQALAIANGKVLALSDQSTLSVWDVTTALLEKTIVVPGGAVAIDAAQDSTVVAIATGTGVAVINYASTTSLPSVIARGAGNVYYKKAAASATRLYLFDGRVIDAYELGSSAGPRWLRSMTAAGVIDLAASDTMLFTLASNQTINAYSASGVLLRSSALNAGPDVVPLSIDSVAGAPWVSFSRGCTTTGCEKRTNVLDPQSLVAAASFAGGVIDVTANGARAYAIFDLPVETRIYDVSDSLHPSVLATRPTDVTAVAISYSNGTVYLLADKAYAYSETSLTRTGEQLAAVPPSSAAGLVIDNGCATIAGRSPAPETYALPQWTAAPGISVPGSIRTLTLAGGRLVILTDYSIEIWSRSTATKSPKRHSVAP